VWAGWPRMTLAGLGRACRAGFSRCEAQPPDRSQYAGGRGGMSPGADDQDAVDLATGARKQRQVWARSRVAPPGASVRYRAKR
jgi:hypothetical protein